MNFTALGLVLIFAALGALHFYWGFGGFWPGSDPRSLNERVAGTTRNIASGFTACALVGAALFAAAMVVVLRQGRLTTDWRGVVAYGGYGVLMLVFGLRGLAPYVTPIFNYARSTPFYELNRRYYSPLCLLICLALITDYPSGLDRFLADLFGRSTPL